MSQDLVEMRTSILDEITHQSNNQTRSHLDSHTFIHSRSMNNQNQINSIGFTIKFQTPYNNCEWRTQSFTTREEAERMIAFYRSCGSRSEMV
jgi:hypothetical protein